MTEEQNLLTAIRAAFLGGIEIMNIYSNPVTDLKTENKADGSPVTIADKRADSIISNILIESYPVLSEESAHAPYAIRKRWNKLWVVDPLDGTKEFIRHSGEFTVNIALIEGNKPILGVIYIPVEQTLYFALQGLGAFKTEHFIKKPNSIDSLCKLSQKLPIATPTHPYTILTSRSHLSEETIEYINQIKALHKDAQNMPVGSSIKMCRIAEGTADLYPRFGPTMEWDTAAGHAICLLVGKNIYHIENMTQLVYNKEDLYNPSFVVK